jgi:glycopeptide antibiotics resistance protein
VILVVVITAVPLPIPRFRNANATAINFVPILNSIKCFVPDEKGKLSIITFCLKNLVGNVILFVPLGILSPLVSEKFCSLKRLLIFASGLSLCIESIQFFSGFFGNFRYVDIDDILLNTLGACLGFSILCLCKVSIAKWAA